MIWPYFSSLINLYLLPVGYISGHKITNTSIKHHSNARSVLSNCRCNSYDRNMLIYGKKHKNIHKFKYFSLIFFICMILSGRSSSLCLFFDYLGLYRSVLCSGPSFCLIMSLYNAYLFNFSSFSFKPCYLLFLLNIFYFDSIVWPTIFPALVFLELDFFVLLDYLFNGSWSTISFFLWGKVRIS